MLMHHAEIREGWRLSHEYAWIPSAFSGVFQGDKSGNSVHRKNELKRNKFN